MSEPRGVVYVVVYTVTTVVFSLVIAAALALLIRLVNGSWVPWSTSAWWFGASFAGSMAGLLLRRK